MNIVDCACLSHTTWEKEKKRRPAPVPGFRFFVLCFLSSFSSSYFRLLLPHTLSLSFSLKFDLVVSQGKIKRKQYAGKGDGCWGGDCCAVPCSLASDPPQSSPAFFPPIAFLPNGPKKDGEIMRLLNMT
jgi:hypothetical protein